MPVPDPTLFLSGLIAGMGAGCLGGLLAGLAGLGGGVIYVPLFLIALSGRNAPLALPIFASLVAVAMTSWLSARSHWRLGHIDLATLRRLAPSLIAGAILGLWFTLHTPDILMLLFLGLLNTWLAWDCGQKREPSPKACSSWLGLPIGYISASLGIGGGTMLIPLLRRHLELRQAVGTTTACTLTMVPVTIGVNLLLEPAWRALLAQHAPFLFGAWLGLVLVASHMAKFGASLHKRYDEKTIRALMRILYATLAMLWFAAAVERISG
ncbi:MAG: sulfite exporter TauE/SafE family protein [Zetaproteobacteria bacterium]|nr:MAG: sulfite exporter TauE/SafE family protein [Zetaproteobacteria bacterium]